MKLLFLFLSISMYVSAHAAVPEPVWASLPWLGKSKGDASLVDVSPVTAIGDAISYDRNDYDCGSDSYGWWANLEYLEDPMDPASRTAIIEMRLVVPENAKYNGSDSGYAFYMGAAPNEQGAKHYEQPQVAVSTAELPTMWVASSEVSQDIWEVVMNQTLRAVHPTNNASFSYTDINLPETVTQLGVGDMEFRPVESQTWDNAKDFCDKMTARYGVTVRLPSEKEWEYLCRAGTGTAFFTGRILEGNYTGSYDVDLMSVTTSKMLFSYDNIIPEQMWHGDPRNEDQTAGDSDPGQQDGYTDPWSVTIKFVNADKTASWSYIGSAIRGTLTIGAGSKIGLPLDAVFDSRYQHRYVQDTYGDFAPILMLYKKVGDRYEPAPFATPGAGFYYRRINVADPIDRHNDNDYETCDSITLAVLQDPNDADNASAWEYREMIRLHDPLAKNFSVREPNGTASGRVESYPVLLRYIKTPFYTMGSAPVSTYPMGVGGISQDVIEDLAKSKVPDNESTTTYKYIENYVKAGVDMINTGDPINANSWFASYSARGMTPPYTSDVLENFSGTTSYHNSWTPMQDNINVEGGTAVEITQSVVRNDFGLIHMHGNVAEWCSNEWDGKSKPGDVSAMPGAVKHYAVRGGSWLTGADHCRSAARETRAGNRGYSDVGFRIVIPGP